MVILENEIIHTQKHREHNPLEKHKQIIVKSELAKPYYEFTDKGLPPYLQIKLSDNLTLTAGPIGSFTAEQLSRIIEEQTETYIARDTMGSTFPKDDPVAEAELLGIMASGYDANRVIVVVSAKDTKNPDAYVPIAGAQGMYGDITSKVPLKDVMFGQEVFGHTKPSSLSPFQALRLSTIYRQNRENLPVDTQQNLREFLQTFGKLPESQAIVLSRLFNLPKEKRQDLGLNRNETSGLAWTVMAALGTTIEMHNQTLIKRGIAPAQLAIYDTHSDLNTFNPNEPEQIQDFLTAYFGMTPISFNGDVEPTAEVLETVLKHHYQDLGKQLIIGAVSMEEYAYRSNEFLDQKYLTSDTIQAKSELFPEFTELGVEIPENHEADLLPNGGYQPEIIDPKTPEGINRLQELTPQIKDKLGEIISSYELQVKEITELQQSLNRLPNSPELIANLHAEHLHQLMQTYGEDISKDELLELFNDPNNTFIEDMAWLRGQLNECASSTMKLNQDAQYAWYPQQQELRKILGPKAFNLITFYRSTLGIIPFDQIRKLQSAKIVSAGSSAVMASLESLGSMGATNLTVVDGGIQDPSNSARFPGGASGVLMNSEPKVHALMKVLFERNPYANHQGIVGKVVANPDLPISEEDIYLKDLVKNADFMFEVIDNLWIKSAIRSSLAQNSPELPIGYLADTANNPFFGIELAGEGNHYNQGIDDRKLQDMSKIPEQSYQIKPVVISNLLTMLGEETPEELQLATLSVLVDGLHYLPQTSIAARMSSAMVALNVMKYLNGETSLAGTNFYPDTIDSASMPNLDPKNQETLKKVVKALLK